MARPLARFLARARRPLVAACLSAAPACAEPELPEAAVAAARAAGLSADPADASVALLAWQPPPPDCPWVFRLTTSYDVMPMGEEAGDGYLLLGAHPTRRPPPGWVPGVVPRIGQTIPVNLYYEGPRVGRAGARRDVYLGARALGPAAPTAACTARTWDPMEDAATLGWPELPAGPVAVGERWQGARVGGRCNKTACIDPETYAGGRDNHLRACVTERWQETLTALLDSPTGVLALVTSSWDDGHAGQGISATRRTLLSVEHGRPLWSRTVIHHRFPQPTDARTFEPIERTWQLSAIDGCGGGLAVAGASPGPDDAERTRHMIDRAQTFEQRTQRRARSP